MPVGREIFNALLAALAFVLLGSAAGAVAIFALADLRKASRPVRVGRGEGSAGMGTGLLDEGSHVVPSLTRNEAATTP